MPERYTHIEHKDGSMQVAYKNQPLYLWEKGKTIGDLKGNEIGGVWQIARP